ncbi:DNA mismatch repair protein MutS [Alkalibacter mobilis]|uniref:DNA mismatch repair protein MutS n=1 Tax=Alkalibacter mobilis TaxID=2787712 RepID=UPI00189D1032|nr:DNA mismatch repair protein MutS [Alkalibacter mobilis]MBF7097623.1 DNA mismatch repair protein MutS [Alkalibacter mobilis]
MSQLTPMMRQYLEVHEKAKDAILFFRLGDFYEMFFDDAVTASKELEITLTGRECGLEEKAPMCGVPYHSAEGYIAKLIEKGYKVAICEQVEDPKESKGIVKRDIVRVISPGTVSEGKFLKDKSNNYLMSIYGNLVDTGIAYMDVSTGEFYLTQISDLGNKDAVLDEIAKIAPSEILINTILYKDKHFKNVMNIKFSAYTNVLPSKYYESDKCRQSIAAVTGVYSVNSLGIEGREAAIKAAGALIRYIDETQMRSLSHIDKIIWYDIFEYMSIDHATRSNLELIKTIRGGEKQGSLLGVLDRTRTSMGSRKLKQWLSEPLRDAQRINFRLDAVESIYSEVELRENLKNVLDKIYDLKRIVGKLSFGNCNGRDMTALKESISVVPELKEILRNSGSHLIDEIIEKMDDMTDIKELIENAIDPDGPISVKDGGIIKYGYDETVDYYRDISVNSKDMILKLEQSEKEKTGIKSLKVKYNKVFGYYIEVTNSNIHLVPDNYIRKQTLSNCERYFTDELKNLENKILEADDKLVELEYEIFQNVRKVLVEGLDRVKETADYISQIDVFYSMAHVAYINNYAKPRVDNSDQIMIVEGRHPVVEGTMDQNLFVPNSAEADTGENRMIIITGPNMAGKSTYIRQIALITLMAQTGSFVPAKKAKIGVVDRIFTRVGASDDLASGQSTFMVEMSEVSNILKNASKKSLVILDEVGRGTSTFDGLSIAWSVVEHLAENIGCKTFFATHYHELTELEDLLEGVKNYCIKVQESENGVIFSRKIVSGNADKSYGIEVAKLAGLPESVINRSNELLNLLEKKEDKIKKGKSTQHLDFKPGNNLNLFNYQDKQIIEELGSLPLDDMTPMEAINYLNSLKKRLGGENK